MTVMRTVSKPQNTVDARPKNFLIEAEMANLLPFRKDIELLRCGVRSAVPHCEAQRLCFPLGDAVIAHCSLGLRFGRLRDAVFHNARSLRCAQLVVAKILYTALNIAPSVDAALP